VPEPLLVDVAQAVGLVFTTEVGPVFPQLTDANQQVQQRNMGNGAAVGDYDGDGDLDVYLLAQSGFPNRLFRNDLDLGQKRFTDVTPALLADTGLSRVAHFVDLDNDGDLDLLLLNDDDGAATPPSRIFRNEGGGTFTDATAGSGFRPVGFLRMGCAIADYDRDGLLDLYVTNWGYDLGTGMPAFPGSNRLYRNLGNLVFQDVTGVDIGPDVLARDTFSALFTDLDADGYPDLYVTVDHSFDVFYANVAGQLVNASATAGLLHVGNDMGVACADFDNDDDLDFYVTNITDPLGGAGTTQFNTFYVNRLAQTGQLEFVDEAADRGVEDTAWGWGVEFTDLDNDGDLDLAAVNGFDEFVLGRQGPTAPLYRAPPHLFLNDGRGRFARLRGAGFDDPDDGRALIAFDYDRDGDEDLLVTNHAQPVRLYENRTANQGHWLHVVLSPDHRAIGATVRATTGGLTRRRDVIAGKSYLAGTPSEVHFGLGGAGMVDRLEVRWADGTTEAFLDVPAGQILRLSAP